MDMGDVNGQLCLVIMHLGWKMKWRCAVVTVWAVISQRLLLRVGDVSCGSGWESSCVSGMHCECEK